MNRSQTGTSIMTDRAAPSRGATNAAGLEFLCGGGEMGERIRALDWSQTPIGAPAGWSSSMRMMVSLLLANRFPLLLWWGPRYIQIYNDPYRPVLGTKHPTSLGQPAAEDRKSTRLNSSHSQISYAVFCLKKKRQLT